ncbi:MAG: hypothetical protein M0Z75_15080, partial [Nitrospiraceae bacterium]|nr:hypothetical protein [Nitrospiraceae bacterium]
MKKFVFSPLMFGLLGFPAGVFFFLARILDIDLFWFNYLYMVKLRLRAGYQAGMFSYVNDKEAVSRGVEKLKKIEKNVLYAVSRIGADIAGPPEAGKNPLDTLFLTSFIYGTGGHTRLLQTYVSHMENSKLLVTGRYSSRRAYDPRLQSEAGKGFPRGRILMKQGRGGNFRSEVSGIYGELSGLAPKKLVLFNHPAEMGLLVAALLDAAKRKDLTVAYYHHADDYMPFLGSFFSCHIDLDANQDKKCGQVPRRELIRISTRNRVQRPEEAPCPDLFTAFSFVPVSKIAGEDGKADGYASLVRDLGGRGIGTIMATSRGEGALLRDILERNRCRQDLIEVDEDCSDISKYAGRVHAYLDTFPVGGGMSVVDGLSMGLPVMILDAENHQIFRDPALARFTFSSAGDI